jgi:hypothetical protein
MRRPVAAKAISFASRLPADQRKEYQERFVREAHAAGRLSHPGIVTIYDIEWDEERGVPFIAMEYVPGTTLRDLMKEQGPLEVEQACSIAEAVAEALHAAHQAGVVHRDVKPANILVRETDEAAKIADFGVARLSDSELTRAGTAIGSPAYMSPEQLRGKQVGPAGDLFSLAVILYEALCGDRPFAGQDLPALIYSIVHVEPSPISALMPGLPQGLDAFFRKALAKDPRERFADGEAFRQALREARRVEPAPEERRDPPFAAWAGDTPVEGADGVVTRRSLMTALIALAMVVGILGGLWFVAGSSEAYVQLEARSAVPSGSLSLLVDGKEVYSRDLLLNGGKKRGLLKKVFRGGKQQTFEDRIVVPAGAHELVARVSHADGGSAREATLGLNLEKGETRRIRLVAGRDPGTPLLLRAP